MTIHMHIYPKRKITHLQDFDYSQNGAYFLTIVTNNRAYLFGSVLDEKMVLNDAGKMLASVCHEMPEVIPELHLDTFQIMPDHIHAIIVIEHVGSGLCARPGDSRTGNDDMYKPVSLKNKISLFDIVGRFKSLTTRKYIDGVRNWGWPSFEGRLWQRSFYEHIIRNEQDYQTLADYIQANPMNWEKEKER